MFENHKQDLPPPVFGPAAPVPADRRLTPHVDDIPDAVIALDDNLVLRYANIAAADTLGWQHGDFHGRSVGDLIHPEDLNLALASIRSLEHEEMAELVTIRARTGSGEWRPLEIRGSRRRSAEGEPFTLLVCRDLSTRHRLHLDQGEDAVLRSVMANMNGLVAIIDADLRIRSINGAITRRLGHGPEFARGQPLVDALHPGDREQIIDAVAALRPHESVALDARFLTSDGSDVVTCEFTVNNLTTDSVVGGYIISGQVSPALSDARERVHFLADHDNLTGLLNRAGFMKSVDEMLRRGGGLGLMVIDVARFRSINELYGERVGDAVLATVAARIDEIRSPDLVTARFGGDEFVMAVRSATDADIQALREQVRSDVALPVVVNSQEIKIGLRTAVAFESRPQGLESLLASASNDLMSIKRNADPDVGGISFDAINQRRRQLDQLRAALDAGEIQPYFQPIVATDGEITAVEALVRWLHPVRGLLGVGEILPIAQMAGLMEAIDEHVLGRSLAFARRLADRGFGHVEVHVNVDPKVMAQGGFATSFLHRCSSIGTDPAQIVVELTETDLLAPSATALANMSELRRAGTHVSIDDFGTGYSSLAHLLELPVDGVKIDQRFVAGIDVDPTATNLTTAILGLSESLHLGCVAEGVEQPYQRDRLAEMGCNAFQGWLFSRAVAADDAIALLPRIDSAPVSSRT